MSVREIAELVAAALSFVGVVLVVAGRRPNRVVVTVQLAAAMALPAVALGLLVSWVELVRAEAPERRQAVAGVGGLESLVLARLFFLLPREIEGAPNT